MISMSAFLPYAMILDTCESPERLWRSVLHHTQRKFKLNFPSLTRKSVSQKKKKKKKET